MNLKEIWDQGRGAYLNGVARERNPYDEGTCDWKSWDDGWIDESHRTRRSVFGPVASLFKRKNKSSW